jgi:integrase
MSPSKVDSASSLEHVEANYTLHVTEQERMGRNGKSGRKVAGKRIALSKADARFWLPKLFKWEDSPNYSLRVQFRGKRMTFSLGTGNKEAAARSAARIYSDLLALGVEATIAKHRAQGHRESSSKVATIGEWIEEARGVSASNAATFAQYAASLRLIAGQILSVRKTKKRFGPGKGGAQAYRQGIDAASLEILSPQAVQRWRLAYVAKAANPAQERSRMTSANSTIRQAKSLFADKMVRFLPDVQLPSPRPFSGVEFFPKQSARYFSRIDAQALLREAQSELSESDPPAFLAMLLALAAGLRRGEIDSLAWHQIDFDRALIRVEATESASLKTAESRGEVPVDSEVAAILRGFRAKASGPFVIEAEGGKYGPRVWGRHYRADAVFTRLNDWLRKHDVRARKPLHELRKELGSLITAERGIYAASRVLRHSNVATTAAHYTDLKIRPTIAVGAWLKPENVVPMPTLKRSKAK